jgi:hypothetical protein
MNAGVRCFSDFGVNEPLATAQSYTDWPTRIACQCSSERVSANPFLGRFAILEHRARELIGRSVEHPNVDHRFVLASQSNVLPLSRGNRARRFTALGASAAPSGAAAELDGG